MILAGDEDVAGLDIPMDDLFLVSVLETFRKLPHETELALE